MAVPFPQNFLTLGPDLNLDAGIDGSQMLAYVGSWTVMPLEDANIEPNFVTTNPAESNYDFPADSDFSSLWSSTQLVADAPNPFVLTRRSREPN